MAIEIRGLAPLFQVFDMPTSVAFYRDTLGFQIVANDGKPVPDNDWVMLELNGSHLMLNTAYEADQRPPAPDVARMASHGDTCIYFACPDVDGAHRYLSGKGVQHQSPKVAPYGMKQLYLLDPDGYSLCFQWTADKSEWSKAS